MAAIWRTNVAVIGREAVPAGKDGLDIRRHRPVHAGHLHFVIEIGAVTKAADQQRRTMGAGGIDHQIVEGDDGYVAGLAGQRLRQRTADQLGSLFEGEERRLAGMDADRDDHLFGDVQRWTRTSTCPLVIGSKDPG